MFTTPLLPYSPTPLLPYSPTPYSLLPTPYKIGINKTMAQLNFPEKVASNGHKKSHTDLVTLEKNSLNYHQESLSTQTPKPIESSSEDWSYATKELLDALPQR